MKLLLFVVAFIVTYIIFSRSYQKIAHHTTNHKVLTVSIELYGSMFALLFIPFFEFKWPSNYRVYLLLGISIIFYAISDRLNTIVRSKTESSTFMILRQLTTIFLVVIGLVFLKEPFVLNKFIGSLFIILGNIIVFFENKKIKFNKYVLLAVISNLSLAIALLIDVNLSEYFNLSIYVFLTLFIPGIIIMLAERIKINDIKKEIKKYDYKLLLITASMNAISIIVELLAYRNGNVAVVAPLCSLTIIIDVLYELCFKNEKNNVMKKIAVAILIAIGVLLINII